MSSARKQLMSSERKQHADNATHLTQIGASIETRRRTMMPNKPGASERGALANKTKGKTTQPKTGEERGAPTPKAPTEIKTGALAA